MNQFNSPVLNAFLPILRGSCSYPDYPGFVKELNGERIDKIIVTPNMTDLPILIGSGGRQVKAYRLLFSEAGAALGKATEFHLEESYEGHRQPKTQCNEGFSTERFLTHFDHLLVILFGKPPSYLRRLRTIGADEVFEITVDLGSSPTERHFNIVTALNDVCFPYGKRRGIEIRISRRRYSVGT